MKRERTIIKVCFFAFFINLILFFIKLYVSLSSNSISIFSDGINNLSDSLSCVLSAAFMFIAVKYSQRENETFSGKFEQLLSFVLSVAVFVVGLGFAYSSAERLMYPTPVWFSEVYFAVIFGTAVVKFLMFLFFSHVSKKTGSSVLRVMKTDSLMDTGITAVTLISFTITRYTDFTADAFAGILISIFIIIQSFVFVKQSIFGLLNIVPRRMRDILVYEIKEITDLEILKIEYNADSQENVSAYLSLKAKSELSLCDMAEICEKINNAAFEKTGIKTKIVIENAK